MGFVAAGLSGSASAQISFSTAVDLSVKNSPKVKAAQADVDKAKAAVQELRDAYIPTVTGGSGLGPPSYGFPLGNPSIFTISSQSLVFSYSQRDYIRSARAALDAANLTLADTRQSVAEDAALTCIALDRDVQRQTALGDEAGFSSRLIAIVQERLDAGQDTALNMTAAKLTNAQIRLAKLRAEDETEADRAHLAQLIGLPERGLGVTGESIPEINLPAADRQEPSHTENPAVASAYAIAQSKLETAFGDSRYLFRPQITFGGQYERFAEFYNYQLYYSHFQQNNAVAGVQITLPLFDMAHRAKARASAAEAAHFQHQADAARDQYFSNRARLKHSIDELSLRAEVAGLDRQFAQQQLEVLLVQLKAGNGGAAGAPMSPKDEQTSRIAEREKFLAVLDANYQMKQAQINFLRQIGELDSWVRSAAAPETIRAVKP